MCHLPSIREDNELERLFSSLPPRCIVLLEDIDAVGTKRKGHYDGAPDSEKKNEEGSESDGSDDSDSYSRSRCTLSGLLNVLDGVSSQEGRIVLMTSNMAHKLDKALVRPGRIDKMIFLGNISSRSAELMFLRMYAPDDHLPSDKHNMRLNEELQTLALDFSSCIPDNLFTPAQLQGFLLNRRDSATRAAREIQNWVDEEKKALDDAKQKAKDAAAWRSKKRKRRALEKIAKNLEKVAKDDKEVEDELEKLAVDVERKGERVEPSVHSRGEETVKSPKKHGDETELHEGEKTDDASRAITALE